MTIGRGLRSGLAPLTGALAAVALLAAGAPSPAAAASTHAAIAGASPLHDSAATDVGAYSASQLPVTLVLGWRDASGLSSLLAAPHAPLTPSEFRSRFSPSPETVAAVRSWAANNGLSVRSVSANRALVTVTGSSREIAGALGTQFDRFHSSRDGDFFAATGQATLPAALAPQVRAIIGLSSLEHVSLQPPARRSASALGAGVGAIARARSAASAALPSSIDYPAQYTPQQLWSMYDAPAAQTGSGQQLSIITEGDLSGPRADLATFEKLYGLPSVTWNQIDVGTQSTDTSGDDEWDLDSQYSTAFAPGVTTLNVYDGPSLADADILSTIDRWVTDDLSNQGSFSAGECDLLAEASGFATGLDAVLQQADAQGQTMFFSSGDTGSQCPALVGVNGVPVGIPDTNYPASSPYGIGVGGTTVLSPDGPSEIAWYAGGGGLSPIEPVPSFQSSTTILGAVPLAQRGVPDVSLDADPESGYDVVVGGTVEAVGGTSAGAPSWQGIWARAEAAHGGALGFAGPILYQSEPAGAFHDITVGSNGLYPAGPGYDLVTGLGTPDIAKLVSGG